MNRCQETKVGDRFGSLLIIEDLPYPDKGHRYVLVECICGTKYSVRVASLITQSILKCRECRKPANWKGCGEIPSNYFIGIKRGAEVRGLDFSITIQDMWEQFLKQDGRCAYTNRILSFKRKQKYQFDVASLDRIDNQIGYVSGNIQWVCKELNHMKGTFSETQFLTYIKEIVNHRSLDIANL